MYFLSAVGGGWGGGAARTQLVSHEIAHQWWGNFVNLSSSNAAILSEGMAEFSSALHWEKVHESRSNFISNGMSYLYTVPKASDIALSASAGAGDYYTTLAYDKASVVFDMLKHEMGEELFYKGLRHYMDKHGYGAASLADFILSMEEGTDTDLTVFADQWFYNAGYPVFVAEAETLRTSEGDWKTEITLRQKGDKVFSLSLPVSGTQADQDRVVSLPPMEIAKAETVYTHVSSNPYERFNVDPSRIYLHRIYSENVRDPNLSGIEDGSDLIDLSAMLHRNIVFSYGNDNYFYPNSAYNSRYDLNQDGIIGFDDIDLFLDEEKGEEPESETATEENR